MHALLIPLGSHGDVHPFVGLGLALKARGHRVTVATNEHFAPLVERCGLAFEPVGTEEQYRQAIEDPDLWAPIKSFRLVMSMHARMMEPLWGILERHHVSGETVVAAPVTCLAARVAEEVRGLALATVDLQPVALRSAIEPPVLPFYPIVRRLPVWARRKFFDFLDVAVADPVIGPPVNAFRARFGLPPVRHLLDWWHSPRSVLGLFPDWFAPPQPDWPPNVTLAGFPLFDEADHSVPDPEVEVFLAAGPPPVVFTAGSAMVHGADFFREGVEACRRLGRRGVLLARFDAQIPRGLPDSVRHFHYVPFSRILPRAAALVHHGGIGTMAQALAAGIPQLVMPLAHDQPDNAARLERLGVGRTLPPRRFEAGRVAAALQGLLDDPAVGERARALAARTDGPSALERACAVLEGLAPARPAAARSQ
jgi:UDP:flavonoid glycosyltransferase YjiC (YdhE family)